MAQLNQPHLRPVSSVDSLPTSVSFCCKDVLERDAFEPGVFTPPLMVKLLLDLVPDSVISIIEFKSLIRLERRTFPSVSVLSLVNDFLGLPIFLLAEATVLGDLVFFVGLTL